MQEVAAARGEADERAQPLAAAGDQAGGQVAFGDEAVRPVEVGGDRLEQVGALDEAAGDARCLLLLDQHRDMRERPGALVRAGGTVLAEEDAGVAQVLVAAGEAAGDVLGREPGEMVDELAPDRPDPAVRVEQFVRRPRRRPVGRQQARDRVVEGSCRHAQIPGARRRSSVIGNSRAGASAGGT